MPLFFCGLLLALPWPALAARMEVLRWESRVLKDNPLHDPAVRSVAIFLPAQTAPGARLPVVYYLPGFGGSPAGFISHSNDWLKFTQQLAEDVTPMALVVVDGRTRWGCGQYLNSPAQGNYEDYLCDEVVPAVEARFPAPTNGVRRIIAGHSSGGFGALRLGSARQNLFDGVIALSPDSDFPVSHLPLVKIAAVSNAPPAEIDKLAAGQGTRPRNGDLDYAVSLSAAYAPRGILHPGQFDWLYDRHGNFREDVWQRWLDNDPLTIVKKNPRAFAPCQMVYLDGAAQDEYSANIGARAIYEVLRRRPVRCTFYEPPGHHGDRVRERLERGLAWVGGTPVQAAHTDRAFTEFFRQTNGWTAGDVATSIPLSDGRVLWLFGDSYLDQLDPASGTLPSLFNARNAVLLQRTNDWMHPQTLRAARSGDQSFFRPPDAKAGESWPCFWPGAGFQRGHTIYVHLTEMQQTPAGGMWGFKAVGQYWGKLSFPELKITGYVKLPPRNGIAFGCGFVTDEQAGFTCAFGGKRRGLGSDVYVARFLTANPEAGWSFWDGKNWSANVTNAAVIAHGASTSVNVCQVRGKFLLVTTEFSVACDQGREIYLSISDQPTGPFSPRQRIFTVDDAVNGHHPFFYSAVAHPEFINADGLLITYCINGYEPCVPNCVNGRMNPDYYRPRAIRLPLN